VSNATKGVAAAAAAAGGEEEKGRRVGEGG